jgi:hypothetical protein
VSAALHQAHCKMLDHPFTEDKVDITKIGFYIGVDPSNFLRDNFEAAMRNQIIDATNLPAQSIPTFKCRYVTPTFDDDDGQKVSTQSYDVQCWKSDAKVLIDLIEQTYGTDSSSFVFYKRRHTDLLAYQCAILQQKEYLSIKRIIPIQGVSTDLMSTLRNDLLDIEGIFEILEHRQTTPMADGVCLQPKRTFDPPPTR